MSAPAGPSIVKAMIDPKLFGTTFSGETWSAWRTVLAAIFALPPSAEDMERYRALTGRKVWPTEPFREAWLVAGRRAGKSRAAALVAVYLAAFKIYDLAPGERAVIAIVAADRAQAKVTFRYVRALFDGSRLLRRLVQNETSERLELTNGVDVEVATCSYRTTRGRTYAAVICDEAAYWRDETTANPDVEVVAALRPGLSTLPGALLVGISSPYARRGLVWEQYKHHYGRDGSDVLVVQAPTRELNPSVPQSVVDRAMELDPAAAAAEYLAQFRSDIEGFLTREAVEAVVVPGRRELAAMDRVRYRAFVDPSGGSADAMTLAVAHDEDGVAVLDAIRERRPPFSPEDVVEEFAALMKSYRIHRVVGDRYAGEWPRERFRVAGIEYQPAEAAKSDLYRDLLPAVNSGKVELLDHPRLVTQLVGLERRTARGGRDSIDHAPGGHDDVANAAAGALQPGPRRSRIHVASIRF